MNPSAVTAAVNAMRPHEAWQASLTGRLGPEGLFDVAKSIEHRGLFTHWKRVTTPVSLQYFGYVIDTLCGAPEQTELVATFLGYIRQQVERALTEPHRWEDDASGAWGFPFLKATRWYDLQRSDLYSRALLGEPFTVEDRHFEALQGSAADWAAETGRNWDESSQSSYIECALVALAWGRLDMAQSLLKVRRSFKLTQRYVDWSRELVAQLAMQTPGQPVSQDSALWAHFHSLFDELRHPTRTNLTGEAAREAARRGEAISSPSKSLLRLTLAMIKQRWLLNKPIEPGLRDVITLISE